MASLAAGFLAAGAAQAATLFRTVEQSFSISDMIIVNQQTIFAPGNVTLVEGGAKGVDGEAILSGTHRVTLEGFDPALGTLESVAIEITSQRSWTSGISAGFLEYKPGGALLQNDQYIRTTLDGAPFDHSSLPGPLSCFVVNDARSCANLYNEPSNPYYAASLDPAGLTAASIGFDIGYTLRSHWYGLYTGEPLANVLNKVDWNGTVRVTYGYAAVPEPAVWAMLLLGFGLTGVALRNRRAALAPGSRTQA